MTAQPTNTPADEAPYWDAALETQTRADWDAMKLELLKAHLQHAYHGSPYYRASFDTAGVHPGQVSSLDDLRRFPFIDKHALRDRQIAVPPLGDLVAVPERDFVYLSASSGSTGVPTASPFTAGDFDAWIDYEARQFWSSGLRPADRYAHCLNFSLFINSEKTSPGTSRTRLALWRVIERAALRTARAGVSWGGDDTRSVLRLRRGGVRAVSYGWGCG